MPTLVRQRIGWLSGSVATANGADARMPDPPACVAAPLSNAFQIQLMRKTLKEKMLSVCNEKISKKGKDVGLSFYAFFSNRNDDPVLLMEAAKWWIEQHRLDHFEKAVKILALLENEPIER